MPLREALTMLGIQLFWALVMLLVSDLFWHRSMRVQSGYVMVMASKFKDYAKYPATIFNRVFRFIFTFIIPITFIAYYPSLVILRPDAVPLLSWLSPLIGCLFFYISYLVWMRGATRYNGTGS